MSKGELPLNNIIFEYTVLCKLMLLLCNLDYFSGKRNKYGYLSSTQYLVYFGENLIPKFSRMTEGGN